MGRRPEDTAGIGVRGDPLALTPLTSPVRDLSIAILAGGHSRRMGSPKPVLRLGSSSVVERVIAAAGPLGAPVVLIAAAPAPPGERGGLSTPSPSARPGSRDLSQAPEEPSLADFLASLGKPVYYDVEPDRGPLGGLHSAFERTGSAEVLLLACDLPFVTTPFLQFLLDRRPLTADALIPESEAGPEPLCALYSSACLVLLERALRGPDLSIRRFVDGLDAEMLRQSEYEHLDPEALLFTNLNTPEDYQRARNLLERPGAEA